MVGRAETKTKIRNERGVGWKSRRGNVARCTTHGGRGVCGPKLVAVMMVMVALAWYSMRGEGRESSRGETKKKERRRGHKVGVWLAAIGEGEEGELCVYSALSIYCTIYTASKVRHRTARMCNQKIVWCAQRHFSFDFSPFPPPEKWKRGGWRGNRRLPTPEVGEERRRRPF